LGHLVAAAFAALAFWPQAGVLGQDLYYANSVDLDPAAGTTLADVPVSVVARKAPVRNRPPERIGVGITVTAGIARCAVSTSIAERDPDYDVVRYRYRWTSGAKILRTVTSAMLTDYVAVEGPVTCTVVASDGRLAAPPVAASS
jgi:hypothetical protein